MQAKARENPVHRLPDWRTTLPLPLGQPCFPLRGADAERETVPVARDEKPQTPNARRMQHRA
jgi:hypothetical protein